MEILKVDYGNGYIRFYVDGLLPLPVRKAKILFDLINEYCSDNEKTELSEHLSKRIAECEIRQKEYANKTFNCPPNSKECKEYTRLFKREQRICSLLIKNLNMIGGTENGNKQI
ncbi:MAG: hypothetical protein LIO87_00560 [Eubacterium sp.]|nr:hypothetical protein [Eubacterium sp.]